MLHGRKEEYDTGQNFKHSLCHPQEDLSVDRLLFNWFLHCVICEEIKGGFVVASIFLTCIVFYKFVVNFKIRMYKKNK